MILKLGFFLLLTLPCVRCDSADAMGDVGMAPVPAILGETFPLADRRRATVTCTTTKSVCSERANTCVTDATSDCLKFQECTGGWTSYCETSETQCTGGMVNKCKSWGQKCSKGWKNVCTKTSEQCREFLPEPFDFLCNVWETICLETSKICQGFEQVCIGGFEAVCSGWGELCLAPTRVCEGMTDVCIGASSVGCDAYGVGCSAYVDVCEVVSDVVDVVVNAANNFDQCMTYAFADSGKNFINTACMKPIGAECYARAKGGDISSGFEAGCSLPDLSLSVMFGSSAADGDKDTAIFSIDVGGLSIDVPLFKDQWTKSVLKDFMAIDASVDFTWVNDASIAMTGTDGGADFELTLPGLFWDFDSTLTLMAEYTNDPCADDIDSCKMVLNKGRSTILDKTFAVGPIPVIIEITAEVYLLMRPKLEGSARLDAKLYFEGKGVEILSTISTPLDDASDVLDELTSMFDPSAIIDEIRQKLRFELSGVADASASLSLCIGIEFGFKVNGIGTDIDVPVCLTAELGVAAGADLNGAELTVGAEIYMDALEVGAELDLPLVSAAIDTACGYVKVVSGSGTALSDCVTVLGCFDSFVDDICDGFSDLADFVDIDQQLFTIEIFPQTSIWSGEFTVSTSSGAASAPTVDPSVSPTSFSAKADWAFEATGCLNSDVSTSHPGQITYWEGKTIDVALRDMWKYCSFTMEGSATSAQIETCCGIGQTCTPTECTRLSVLDWEFENVYVLGGVGTNDCPDGYVHITDVYDCEKASLTLLPGKWHDGHDGYDFGTAKPKGCFQSNDEDIDGYVYFNDDDIGGPEDGDSPICRLFTAPEGYTMSYNYCTNEYDADSGAYGYEDTPDVAICAAQCDALERCVSFIWQESSSYPCRMSYTCTLDTANPTTDSNWQGYYKHDATTGDSCGMEQYQHVYVGCGAVYVMEKDREAQCPETFAQKAVEAFGATGCPNTDIDGVDADLMDWWEARETMADIFYDMWLYCSRVRDGVALDRQVEMCCGAGQTCVPSTCTELTQWPGNHWGTMVLNLEGAQASLNEHSCGMKRGQTVYVTDCGVYAWTAGYNHAKCLKIEDSEDVWTPVSWTMQMPIIFDSWNAPEVAWIPHQGYKASQSGFADKTIRTLQATKAACLENEHCTTISCDADDEDSCYMGWWYNMVSNNNYNTWMEQDVPGVFYMHTDAESSFPVEIDYADKLDINDEFTMAAWVRRTEDLPYLEEDTGNDEVLAECQLQGRYTKQDNGCRAMHQGWNAQSNTCHSCDATTRAYAACDISECYALCADLYSSSPDQEPACVEGCDLYVSLGGCDSKYKQDYSIFGTDSTSSDEGLHLTVRNGKYYMGFYHNDCATEFESTLNQWEHVAFSYQDNRQKIYVNGVKVKECTDKHAFEGTGLVNIGRSMGGREWVGSIKDARVYKNALSDKEVTGLFYLNSHYGQDLVDHGIVVWCASNDGKDIPLSFVDNLKYTLADAQEACLNNSNCAAISCYDEGDENCDDGDACCSMRQGIPADYNLPLTLYKQC